MSTSTSSSPPLESSSSSSPPTDLQEKGGHQATCTTTNYANQRLWDMLHRSSSTFAANPTFENSNNNVKTNQVYPSPAMLLASIQRAVSEVQHSASLEHTLHTTTDTQDAVQTGVPPQEPVASTRSPEPLLLATPVVPLSMLPSDVATLSVQDLAKEAMRITKESIRKEEQEKEDRLRQEEQKQLGKNDDSSITANDLPDSHVISSPSNRKSSTENPESSSTPSSTASKASVSNAAPNSLRLNKFVRRLHDMIQSEQDKGIVEWRRGLLVLHSTAAFAKTILPKFFNTRNFKTFRRQLNYYGFVHVRSFSNTAAATTTALWVHQELAATLHQGDKSDQEGDDLSHILKLRRVEPNDSHKTVEGRRQRKEMALYTVEEDLQVSTKSLQRQQIQALLHMNYGNITNQEASQSATNQIVPPPLASALPPPMPLAVAPCLPQGPSATVPRYISVPHGDTAKGASKHVTKKRDLETADASSTQLYKKRKVNQRVSLASTMSDVSVSSVAVVSEADDEALSSKHFPPPKSTNSAANLLLLLSQSTV